MEKLEIKQKIPGRQGEWNLLERFVQKKIGDEEFLRGPVHRHPFPERFCSTGEKKLVLIYVTRKGKIRRLTGTKLWVDGGIPHQILVPGTGFEIYTCQENLEQEERRDRLGDFVSTPRARLKKPKNN